MEFQKNLCRASNDFLNRKNAVENSKTDLFPKLFRKKKILSLCFFPLHFFYVLYDGPQRISLCTYKSIKIALLTIDIDI